MTKIIYVLIRGGVFSNQTSKSHVLGDQAFTLWETYVKVNEKTKENESYKTKKCLLSNIQDLNEIPIGIPYMKEAEFRKVVY